MTIGKSLYRFLLLALLASAAHAADSGFETEIQPLFNARCLACHDAKNRASGFSVADIKSVVAGGGRYGVAVKPGNPAESPLVKILKGEIAPRMPLGAELRAEEIAKVESWVAGLDANDGQAETRHWSYVKPEKPETPDALPDWGRNEIDRFVAETLVEKGFRPSPETGRVTLIRRLYFDMLGLPPSPTEVADFLADDSADAYEKVVDRLLADPRYGERWGRYWLDLARYSDTNGYEGDTDFPNAWRYRNYVIDAFNSDKPYDVFVREQIAGDEFFKVVSAVPAPAPEPERVVAMTFLRLAPFNRTPVSVENRDSYLTEVTSTVSSVFLGLTVGCAKCHDHKYDQIPQKDFYRMRAFFETLQITNTGRVGGAEPAEFYRPGEKERVDSLRKETEGLLTASEKALADMQEPMLKRLKAAWSEVKPDAKGEPKVGDLERMLNTEGDNTAGFTATRKLFSKEEADAYLAIKNAIRGHKRMLERLEPVAMSVRNADGPPFGPNVPTTYVQVRGQYDQFGEAVEPGFLSAIEGHQKPAKLELDRYKMFPTRGRRMTLANWITSPDNPLTARVMVNRIWQYHFGRGIVETSSDFGRIGSAPTHPKLLDWLALRFVEDGWSIKKMHRLILTSATYRQDSKGAGRPELEKDADTLFLWRFPRRRLEGEVVRDSILAVSGKLSLETQDIPVFPPLPEDLADAQKVQGFNTWETETDEDAMARSVYVFQRRSLNFPFLEVFDAAVPTATCARRPNSTSALQSLTLYNGEFANEQAKAFARRVEREAGDSAELQIERAFELALSRTPNEVERRQVKKFLDSVAPSADALVGLCRVLLNSNEFVYMD